MAQYTPKLNLYQFEVTDEMQQTLQEFSDNMAKIESFLPYEKVGNAAKFLSSLYLLNDNNLFGYLKNGDFANLATMEQNDIAKYGDSVLPALWLVSQAISFRSANGLKVVRQFAADGTATGPIRDIYDVENFSNQAVMQSSAGTLSAPKDSKTNFMGILSTLTQFPAGSVTEGTSGYYTIPRTGLYRCDISTKVTTALTLVDSWIRLGVKRDRGGVVTNSDINDERCGTSYATPFVTMSMALPFNAGDKVSPYITPLSEAVTIGSGSKFHIHFECDMPS